MRRQFVFTGDELEGRTVHLTLSETSGTDEFMMSLSTGDLSNLIGRIYLTKQDASDISDVLSTRYSSYGETIRFQEDPKVLDSEEILGDLDV